MITAIYEGNVVLVKCKSTKNCRIIKDINNPTVTELVPTTQLQFRAEDMSTAQPVQQAPTHYSKDTVPADIYEEFLQLACSLSPENLTCDGELSRSKVIARRNQILRQWQALEKKLGMSVTEDMVWDSYTTARS